MREEYLKERIFVQEAKKPYEGTVKMNKLIVTDVNLTIKMGNAIKEYLGLKDIVSFGTFRNNEEYMVAYMTYDYNKPKQRMDYVIYVPMDGEELIPDEIRNVHTKRISEFLESLDIPENEITVMLCHLLHEFGHIVLLTTADNYDYWDDLFFVSNTIRNYTSIRMSENDIKETRADGIEMIYWLRADEMFSDAFMYKNFMRIYKYLNETIFSETEPNETKKED